MTQLSTPAYAEPPTRARFDPRYWMCAWVEMLERLAYYTLRPISTIYIAQATDPGGLRLPQSDRGTIIFWWAIVASVLPIFTGGLADRYGYKRSLAIALFINTAGYVLMAMLHSRLGFFAGVLVLATGTAFFKPALQGTMAHTLTKATSSLGWGIFYFIVNIGSFIGHMVSPLLLGDEISRTAGQYRMLFLGCAACTVVNLVSLIRFPSIPSGASTMEGPHIVLWRTLVNVFEPRLLTWLLIMSCFWLMMFQLWDLQPNFIEDWTGSSGVARYLPFRSWVETGADGVLRVKQQILLSTNAFLIILLVVPISWIVRRMRSLSALLLGMIGVTAGLVLAGMTMNGWALLAGIALFSVGEMLTGPKTSEYLGLIAPADRKGLYLGYANIPMGLGQALGGPLTSFLYGRWGEKANLSLKYLLQHTPWGAGRNWDGSVASLEQATGVTRSDAFAKLQSVLGKSGHDVTRLLWETYHPQYYVWLPLAGIGVFAAIALAIFGRMARRWNDMNA